MKTNVELLITRKIMLNHFNVNVLTFGDSLVFLMTGYVFNESVPFLVCNCFI